MKQLPQRVTHLCRWRASEPTAATMPATSPPGSPGSPGYIPRTFSTSRKFRPTAFTVSSTCKNNKHGLVYMIWSSCLQNSEIENKYAAEDTGMPWVSGKWQACRELPSHCLLPWHPSCLRNFKVALQSNPSCVLCLVLLIAHFKAECRTYLAGIRAV